MDTKKIYSLTLKKLKPNIQIGTIKENQQIIFSFQYRNHQEILFYLSTFKNIYLNYFKCFSNNLKEIVYLSKIFPYWDFYNLKTENIFPQKDFFKKSFFSIFSFLEKEKNDFYLIKRIGKSFFNFSGIKLFQLEPQYGFSFLIDLKEKFIFQQQLDKTQTFKLILNYFHTGKDLKLLFSPPKQQKTILSLQQIPDFLFHTNYQLAFKYKSNWGILNRFYQTFSFEVLQQT